MVLLCTYGRQMFFHLDSFRLNAVEIIIIKKAKNKELIS